MLARDVESSSSRWAVERVVRRRRRDKGDEGEGGAALGLRAGAVSTRGEPVGRRVSDVRLLALALSATRAAVAVRCTKARRETHLVKSSTVTMPRTNLRAAREIKASVKLPCRRRRQAKGEEEGRTAIGDEGEGGAAPARPTLRREERLELLERRVGRDDCVEKAASKVSDRLERAS